MNYAWKFKVLEGRSYRLQHPWVGIVNRSQADINKNVDMIAARRKEIEYFETSPEYGHLASKMGSEYLAKLLSQVFPFFCFQNLLRLYLILSTCPSFAYFTNTRNLIENFFCQHLETVIRQRIPSIIALINKTIDELNAELDRIGRPIAVDSGVAVCLLFKYSNQFSSLTNVPDVRSFFI